MGQSRHFDRGSTTSGLPRSRISHYDGRPTSKDLFALAWFVIRHHTIGLVSHPSSERSSQMIPEDLNASE
jgi:hypothetical protein